MRITIKMLNVGDGDAIIVLLEKDRKSLLLLIDGGHPGDSGLVLNELSYFAKQSGKKAPDVIICTHYDNDHIGGLKEVIKHYNKEIGEVWIHQTSSLLKLGDKHKNPTVERSSILPSEEDDYLGSYSYGLVESNDPAVQFILESLKQETELINLVNSLGIKITEPIAESSFIDGWPELKVLGPTHNFYKKLFPAPIDGEVFLKEESDALKSDTPESSEEKDPCIAFAKLKRSQVTNPNLNSAIILIEIKDKKFLFTGDAGIESFLNILNYQSILANIFWLKLPHHASKNNMSSEILDLMSPTYSYISGDKYVSEALVHCLKQRGSIVVLTKANGHIDFEYE